MIVERYRYDVFGEPNRVSGVHNPYMFTGRRYDTGTSLYYYRARYYNPEIGRFLQTDPIGYVDGLNMYTYVRNNPVTNVDPFGLDAISGWNPRTPPDYYVPLCCKKHSPGLAEMLGISVIECANMVMGETWKGWRFPLLLYGGMVGTKIPAIGVPLAFGVPGQYAFALSLCYKGPYCEEWGRRDWCGRCK